MRAYIHHMQVSVRMRLWARLNLSRTLVSLPDRLFVVHLPTLVYNDFLNLIVESEIRQSTWKGIVKNRLTMTDLKSN